MVSDPISPRSIELPAIYKLEDLPRAPSIEQIDRLLETLRPSDDL